VIQAQKVKVNLLENIIGKNIVIEDKEIMKEELKEDLKNLVECLVRNPI
jgi:hypothetical protein